MVNRAGKYIKVDYDQVRKLYKEGLTDRQIARKLGHSHCTIERWRNGQGLECNVTRGRINWYKAKKMIDQGIDDAEIATHFGVTRSRVRAFKARHSEG